MTAWHLRPKKQPRTGLPKSLASAGQKYCSRPKADVQVLLRIAPSFFSFFSERDPRAPTQYNPDRLPVFPSFSIFAARFCPAENLSSTRKKKSKGLVEVRSMLGYHGMRTKTENSMRPGPVPGWPEPLRTLRPPRGARMPGKVVRWRPTHRCAGLGQAEITCVFGRERLSRQRQKLCGRGSWKGRSGGRTTPARGQPRAESGAARAPRFWRPRPGP